jgi:hypothetical protein
VPKGPAARITDNVVHPLPPILTGGPPAATVTIGFLPAWKGIPLAAGAALQAAQQVTEAAIKVAENVAVVAQNAATAAAGTPGAPAAVAAAAAARLAAETLKASTAASVGATISSAAGAGASIHACVTPWPVPPHGPGVVIDGSPTVLIEMMPTCRLGDTIIEAIGPPNKIARGEPTVIIGQSGSGGAGGSGAGWMPAPPSLYQQFTNWLGNLFSGPNDQKILFGKSIVIEGSPEFQLKTLMALAELAATPTGREILQNIENSGHTVTIKETTDANGYCQNDGSDADSRNPARGTDSTVSWNPSHNTTDASDPVTGSPGSTVILGHELIHASHNATGTNANGPYDSYPGQSGSSARGEERSTVGEGGTSVVAPDGSTQAVPDYSGSHPTENSLRDDLGIPRRPTYYPSNWSPSGAPW